MQSIVGGRYELRERIGEGAAAIVYAAFDRQLARTVALKIIRHQTASAVRERMRREALAVARLSHPNVVAIYDFGEEEDQVYLVMELVRGEPLSRFLRPRPSNPRPLVEALVEVCAGVQHAHDRGIVHRDLKPDNVLITAGGPSKVGDFGLAHLSDSHSALTRTGAALGTPLYMAPEQVRGDSRQVTAATDVYALGAILYEILAGRPPHEGATVDVLYSRILLDDPPPPRSAHPDLETIALKALRKEPRERYPSAQEFADDLRRHLAGEPIRARPATALSRVGRTLRRHRAVALPVVAAVILIGAWMTANAASRASRLRASLAAAAAHESEGRLQKARDQFSIVLALDASHAAARAGLERIDRRLAEAGMLLESGRPAIDQAARMLDTARYDDVVRRVDVGQRLVEQAIEKAPELPLGHLLLGRAWEIKGWDDRAEQCYRRAIELDGRYGPARLHLARILLARGALDAMTFGTGGGGNDSNDSMRRFAAEATRELQAAPFSHALHRTVAEAMQAHARSDYEAVRAITTDGAAKFAAEDGVEELHWLRSFAVEGATRLEALDEALRIRPGFATALLFRAVCHHGSRARERALADLDRALAIHPRFTEAYFCRAQIRTEGGDVDGALADYGEAVRLRPAFVAAWHNRAALRESQGDAVGAIADYTEAIRARPDAPWSFDSRGVVRFRSGDVDGALADFDEALRLDPQFGGAHHNRGFALIQKGDLPGALRAYDEAIRCKKTAGALVNRAHVRLMTGDSAGASADLDDAIALDAAHVPARLNRANLRRDLGDVEGALEDFSVALRAQPDHVGARLDRGILYNRSGRVDEARADLDAVLGRDPRNADALFWRAEVRLRQNDVDGSVADCDEAIRLRPAFVEALVTRATARRTKGDLKGAVDDCTEALRHNPRSPEALATRALAKSSLRDVAGALADAERALAEAPAEWAHRPHIEKLVAELKRR